MRDITNRADLQKMGEGDLEEMLHTLDLCHFEPYCLTERPELSSRKVMNSGQLIDNLRKYLEGLSVRRNFKHYARLASLLLHTNPALFLPERDRFQTRIAAKHSEL